MNPIRIDRRTLLRGIGACVALPMLEIMTPLTAFAQASSRPLRMAFMFVPNGINMEHWRPTNPGPLPDALPKTLASLNDLRSEISLISGLTQRNAFALGDGPGDHARSSAVWLTGVHPTKTTGADIHVGLSCDQLAAKLAKHKTKFASLELGCERGTLAGDCDSGYACAYSNAISWSGPSTPVAKETNPRAVFERLFGTDNTDEDAQSRAQRARYNLSVLDFVKEEADSLSSRLGNRDQQKLDEYLTAIRDIELRLAEFEKAQTLHPTMPNPTGTDFGDQIRLMGDMMVLAFQADLTRICTFMLANEGSNRPYRMLGITDGHHEISHHGDDQAKLDKKQQIDAYHVEQLAYVLRKLKSTPDVEGTLLDNTMLVYGGGISDGNRHNHDDLPILLAGRAGGALKPGVHRVVPNGTPLNNLYVSMLDRMGIHGETLGDANGPLDGLF